MDIKVDDPAGADAHAGRWRSYLGDCAAVLDFVEPMQVAGRVTRVAGLVMDNLALTLLQPCFNLALTVL